MGTLFLDSSAVFAEMIPNILDLFFVITTFGTICGGNLAWLMVLVLTIYILVLALMSKLRDQQREQWSEAKKKRDNLASDTTANWWTVCIFGRLNYENGRYAEAVRYMRAVDNKWSEGYWLRHNTKHLVLVAGLLLTCLVVSYEIWSTPGRSAGDLVMFLHFWDGVTGPV